MAETPLAARGHDPVVNADPGTVTVWSDIGCPWASLALHTLRAAAARRGGELRVDHRAFPLELFNRMPTPKHIVDAEIVVIGGYDATMGWRMWPGPDCAYPVTMLPAMEAVQAAKDPEVGGLSGSDELDAALRDAFYAQGRCVSIPAVILEVAGQCAQVDAEALAHALAHGRGRAEVYRDWRTAQQEQVQGSPHLFTADGFEVHNPGVTYRWSNRPPTGFPRLLDYDAGWAEDLLDHLDRAALPIPR
ncbi:DsbA family oxidoreductase [Actinophytocola xanthii]|uniref:Dithiol-disulfide isomerase n=1 Tax=Actinophytocola xanthii TaxID=1912961 RepID=A0A1Q8C5H3_9PSEU|nr:dithiol-disulfide isomerase [Actinophytocola xanthii]OLF09604.1 dithiol-disulfide isomerase [Actinophytocola xanthii]